MSEQEPEVAVTLEEIIAFRDALRSQFAPYLDSPDMNVRNAVFSSRH